MRRAVLMGLVAALAGSGLAGEFEEWQKQQEAALRGFVAKSDAEFAAFLERDWREFQLMQGAPRLKAPKPPAPPVAEPPAPGPAPVSRPVEEVPPPPAPEAPVLVPPVPPEPTVPPEEPSFPEPEPAPPQPQEEPTPPVPPEPQPAPPEPEAPPPPPEPELPPHGQRVEIPFFGTRLALVCDPDLCAPLGRPIDGDAISAFWQALRRARHEELVDQAQALHQRLGLNDWGYCFLAYQIGQAVCTPDRDRGMLLAWSLLLESGYNARVAYDQQRVHLLLPASTTLYSVPYFTFGEQRFYAMSFDGQGSEVGAVYTYDGSYAGAEQTVDLTLPWPPSLPEEAVERTLSFAVGGVEQRIRVRLNRNAVDFLGQYPETDLAVYFSASPSPATGASLLEGLRPLVQGQSELEAVNRLLACVQKSLDYQVDDEQFGRERTLFAEESLFYPYSDCEDRAVLFAYLVRNLLGLPVVGLTYPGHVAAAVQFSDPIPGTTVEHQGATYTVCDPTYINATAGMCMPDYENTQPEVTLIGG
ncbi:MAG: hypothetical protein AB1505_20125 [Candidatus Latescibacterota bacterium]